MWVAELPNCSNFKPSDNARERCQWFQYIPQCEPLAPCRGRVYRQYMMWGDRCCGQNQVGISVQVTDGMRYGAEGRRTYGNGIECVFECMRHICLLSLSWISRLDVVCSQLWCWVFGCRLGGVRLGSSEPTGVSVSIRTRIDDVTTTCNQFLTPEYPRTRALPFGYNFADMIFTSCTVDPTYRHNPGVLNNPL